MKAQQVTRVIGTQSADAVMADFWGGFLKRNNVEQPPPGSINAIEYAERSGISVDAARGILDRRTQKGELVRKRVRRKWRGTMRIISYYAPNRRG